MTQSAANLHLTAKTLADSVYLQLRSDIIGGKLEPDSKLKVTQLREAYDVGATPIREALSRLSSDGFVLMEGQRGFRVSPVSAADLMDVTEMRIMLELKALRSSLLHGDDVWESRVVSTYYQLSKSETDSIQGELETWEQRNHDFHRALLSACTSRWLVHFYNTIYDQHKRYRNISLDANLGQRDVHAEHQRIYEAALKRDVETCCRETEAHIRQTAEITQKVLLEQLGE